MNSAKKKGAQLLALFLAVVLLPSNLGSVAALAVSATGTGDGYSLDGYTLTDNLTDADKSDNTQANYQELSEDCTYTTSFTQAAKWTNKEDGEAELSIHYEAEFNATTTATRSLYVFTTCNVHSFSITIAIENILDLLEYNEYVDIIMIGTANSKSGTTTWDVTAASMFSLRAEDNLTTNKIKTVLKTYSTEGLKDIEYVYGLGQTSKGTEKVEVLYDKSSNVTYPTTYYGSSTTTFATAAELALSFGGRRHSGAYFSLYYIAQYIDIIEDENNYGSGSFSSTVKAIFNSGDAFATACHSGSTDNYSTDTLYDAIKEYTGLDMTNSLMSLSDMQDSENGLKCWNALSVLQEYSSDGRYVALIPDETTSRIYNFNDGYYTSSVITTEQRQNMLLFALTIMAPSIVEDESEARSTISNWLDTKTTVTIEDNFQTYNKNIYAYSKDLNELDILQSVYTTNSVTITTKIISEFEITDTGAITVVNSGDENSYFSCDNPEITPNSDGTTTVSIYFYNLSDDDLWAIDISIPMRLKTGITSLYTDNNDWTDVAIADTWAEAKSVSSKTNSTEAAILDSPTSSAEETTTVSETATVPSPKLYKGPVLAISKEGTDETGEELTTVDVGDTIYYTLTITQTAEGETATGIAVEDTLPEGLSYVDDVADIVVVEIDGTPVSGATVTVDGNTLKVEDIGSLEYGKTLTITYQATVDAGTEGNSLTNVAKVTSYDAGDGEATWTVTVNGGTTSTTSGTDDTTTTDGSLPQTGDTTNPRLALYAAITSALAVSAIVSGFMLRRRDKYQGAHFRRI